MDDPVGSFCSPSVSSVVTVDASSGSWITRSVGDSVLSSLSRTSVGPGTGGDGVVRPTGPSLGRREKVK